MNTSMPERKYRLLVAEDDLEMRSVLHKTLTREGFDVDVAANGLEAYQTLATRGQYDVLISDIQMPLKGAEELVPEAKSLYPGMKIIVISGYSELDLYLKLMNKGAFDFVTKPFKIPDLLEVIFRAVRPADNPIAAG